MAWKASQKLRTLVLISLVRMDPAIKIGNKIELDTKYNFPVACGYKQRIAGRAGSGVYTVMKITYTQATNYGRHDPMLWLSR